MNKFQEYQLLYEEFIRLHLEYFKEHGFDPDMYKEYCLNSQKMQFTLLELLRQTRSESDVNTDDFKILLDAFECDLKNQIEENDKEIERISPKLEG